MECPEKNLQVWTVNQNARMCQDWETNLGLGNEPGTQWCKARENALH